jgi:hypothetical protein
MTACWPRAAAHRNPDRRQSRVLRMIFSVPGERVSRQLVRVLGGFSIDDGV